jgi:hypothetical protein
VIRALRETEGAELSEDRPLYEAVDLDALDALFRGPNPGTVTFEYQGYTVEVRGDAEVVVEE